MIYVDFNKFFNATWKVILVIALIIVAFFVIFGLIGRLIQITMEKQGMGVDHDMANLVISKLVDNKKDFKSIAKYKSRKRFFKASIAPFILLLISLILYLIHGFLINNFTESIFDSETGIGSLFYKLDWSSVNYYPPFGIDWNKLIWIKPVVFQDLRIFNYFIFLFLFIGVVYYLVCVQAYIARSFRINKLSKTIYSVNLDKVDLQSFYDSKIKNVESNESPSNNN